MAAQKLYSSTTLSTRESPSLLDIRKDICTLIEKGYIQFAFKKLTEYFFNIPTIRWTDQKRRSLLRNVWVEIETHYQQTFFDTIVDTLRDVYGSKEIEFKIERRNRVKYFTRMPVPRTLSGCILGQCAQELETEFEFAIQFGKASIMVEMICRGKIELTAETLNEIATYLK